MRISLLLLLPLVAFAQTPYGRFTGRVTDTAGAAIAGAGVRITSVETNRVASAKTNSEGLYDISDLLPGLYRLDVELTGFKKYERLNVELHVGDVLDLPVTLELGAITESVTVTAEVPVLESATADVGQVIDNRRITELPLPGGSVMYLMQLSPGVISTNPPTHGWLPQAVDSTSNMGAAGTRTRSSEFSLDGIPNMTHGGQISFSPPPEMIQEYRIQTSPYDSSVGHFSGAYVNMVIKGGTNRLRGTAYYTTLVPQWAAHDFFTNRFIYDTSTGPITKEKIDTAWPPVSTGRYRFTLGGPAYLPKLYDGRNRTFWTWGLDILNRHRPEPGTFTVPTAEERTGDFSALLKLGSQYQIYDPATIAPAATAGRFSRQPFPGNLIPASRIDPMARRILDYFALPNATGTADGTSNYHDPKPRTISYHSNTVRIDHTLGDNHRIYGSYSSMFTYAIYGQAFHNIALGNENNRFHHSLALGGVFVLRPDLVLDLRYGVTRYVQYTRPVSVGFDLSELGFPSSLTSQLDQRVTTFPEININGYATLGGDSGTRPATAYHSLSGTISHPHGTHALRFGGEFRILMENDYAWGNVSPHLDFAMAWTKGPVDNSAASPIGQGLASFLLGIPTNGYTDREPSFAEASRYTAFFIQDDWKIRRGLTMNVGLRYELELPTTERYNRTVRGFDFTTPNPIQAAAQANYAASPIPQVPPDQFQVPGGLLFAGVNGAPRGMWNTDTNNFSPRIGLAFALRPNTILRAGYGIFFESLGSDRNDVEQQGFNQQTTVQPSLDNGLSFRATLANPFPDGLLEPVGAAAGLTAYLGRAPSFFLPTRRAGYMQRWSFNIQRMLPKRLMVELGYMGNRGTGLGVAEEFGSTPAQYLSTSLVRDTTVINALTKQVTNPFYGMSEFAGSGLTAKTVATNQLLRPYPQFTGVTSASDAGSSWYHSLQLRVERRFANGFTVQGAYTFSKFMEAVARLNPTDPTPHHVVSPQDRPHRVIISGIYELPFGARRRWLHSSRIMKAAMGGWSLQGVYLGQSGPAIGFGNIPFYGDLHDIVLPRSERTVERWFNTDAAFERASGRVLAQNLRYFPLRLTGVRADGYNNFDLSIFKSFRVKERFTFQVRGEAQDAMNHAMFSAPNANPTALLFGQVTSSVAPEQRRVNIAGKLVW